MNNILLLFILLLVVCYYNKESFTLYIKNPFGYVDIGTSPVVYYNKPLFREPYRYPFTYNSSYPIKYDRYV